LRVGCIANRAELLIEPVGPLKNHTMAYALLGLDSRMTTMKPTRPLKNPGFTLVEIMIVVAIIGLLAAIAIPNLVRARASSQANACINNLRKLDDAVNQFAIENGKHTGDDINYPSDLKPYIKLNSAGRIPPCPAGGQYDVNKIGQNPTCSLNNSLTPAHVLP